MSNHKERPLLPDIERRVELSTVEVRGGVRRIGGYAATFGQRSEPIPGPMGGFREIVATSFFDKSQGDNWPDVLAKFNHRDDMVLGATRSGTLQLAIDSTGLDYTADLPECRSDTYELVSRGDLGKSSFGFLCFQDDWDYESHLPLRTLISGRLLDVGPCTIPAYNSTSVSLRSLAKYMDAPVTDVEKYAQQGELRRFFVRSDSPMHRDPARLQRLAKRRSGKQAVLETLAARWPDDPITALTGVTPLTVRQKQVEVMRQRWPAEPVKRSGRSALLEVLAMKD
jgi:HK97 family phage prohead protease